MNILPAGSATSWKLYELDDSTTDMVTYFWDGPSHAVGGPERLAEQLRQDGAASSLGAALSMAELAILRIKWKYIDDQTGSDLLLDEEDQCSEEPGIQVLVAEMIKDD